jgi:hypothetical protein
MARLLRKIPKDLNELPVGWQTKEDLVSLLFEDHFTQKIWRDHYPDQALPTVDAAAKILFMKNTWQLTTFGASVLVRAYKSWCVEHQNNTIINGKILINMSRIIQGPWYNRALHTYVWDETTHFTMQMFDGDIKSFVDFHLPN